MGALSLPSLRLKRVGAARGELGAGGVRQIVAEDPSGNPIELFEPVRPKARLAGP